MIVGLIRMLAQKSNKIRSSVGVAKLVWLSAPTLIKF